MTQPKTIESIRRRFHTAQAAGGVDKLQLEDEPCGSADTSSEAQVPPQLAKLFAQRQAAKDASFRPMPQPGQILRINLAQRDANSPQPCDEPLAVLLDAPIIEGKWRGWLVGRDAEYATVWDMILGPEEDPRDPQCEVVQVWNPVTITLAEADRVLAELSDERLGAARMLDRDYVQDLLPTPIHDTRMGVHLARELSDGTGVVTGTPLADGEDARREYQSIYREAGVWVSQGTLPQPPKSVVASRREPFGWLERIFTGGGNWLKPAGVFAVLLLVPLLFMLVNQEPQGPRIVPIAGGDIQELRAAQPKIKAGELETRLRAMHAVPEIKFESGGTISVKADLKAVPETDRNKLYADFGLKPPADGMLRVLIVTASAMFDPASPNNGKP